jgi:AraC-like DNA-binding protein
MKTAGRALLVRLCRARTMLRDTGDRRVKIGDVASAVGMSRFHFIRVFRAVFGETPNQTALTARLDRARAMLETGESSVTDICAAVGFASLGTFSHQFAHRVGVSPARYRRRERVPKPLPAGSSQSPHAGCLTLMSGWPE